MVWVLCSSSYDPSKDGFPDTVPDTLFDDVFDGGVVVVSVEFPSMVLDAILHFSLAVVVDE